MKPMIVMGTLHTVAAGVVELSEDEQRMLALVSEGLGPTMNRGRRATAKRWVTSTPATEAAPPEMGVEAFSYMGRLSRCTANAAVVACPGSDVNVDVPAGAEVTLRRHEREAA